MLNILLTDHKIATGFTIGRKAKFEAYLLKTANIDILCALFGHSAVYKSQTK